MKILELNPAFGILDIFLFPIMYVLGGFKKPVQETHVWHLKKWRWFGQGLFVSGTDTEAKFSHNSPLGLFHMPIFGGLTKYVVIEANCIGNWYVGWNNAIHLLKIKENKIKLLTGKSGYNTYGLSSNGRELKLKIVGSGKIGDGRFSGVRLF